MKNKDISRERVDEINIQTVIQTQQWWHTLNEKTIQRIHKKLQDASIAHLKHGWHRLSNTFFDKSQAVDKGMSLCPKNKS